MRTGSTVGPFDEWEVFTVAGLEQYGYSRAHFAYRGLAFELQAFRTRYNDSDRQYGVALYTRGCSSSDDYNYEDADLAVFGEEYPDEFIYQWWHVPDDAESVLALADALMADRYALEGIILTHAGAYIEALDAFKAAQAAREAA